MKTKIDPAYVGNYGDGGTHTFMVAHTLIRDGGTYAVTVAHTHIRDGGTYAVK